MKALYSGLERHLPWAKGSGATWLHYLSDCLKKCILHSRFSLNLCILHSELRHRYIDILNPLLTTYSINIIFVLALIFASSLICRLKKKKQVFGLEPRNCPVHCRYSKWLDMGCSIHLGRLLQLFLDSKSSCGWCYKHYSQL